MATFHDPVLARTMIQEHGMTKLVAFDLSGNDVIFRVQDKTPEAIIEALDTLLESQEEGFRVEVGKAGDASEKGAKATAWRKTMTWRFRAANNRRSDALPSPPAQPVTQPATSIAPTGYVSKEELSLHVRLVEMQAQLTALRSCAHGVPFDNDCPACADEEDDEEEGETTAEGVAQLATVVKDLIKELRMPSIPKPKEVPISGATATNEAGDDELWSAICAMREQYPKEFAEYKAQLLAGYGKR